MGNLKHQKTDNIWKELWKQTSGNKIDGLGYLEYHNFISRDNYFISFPRSGHHAVVTALLYYFNLNGLNYCASYNCCSSIPCQNNKKKDLLFNISHDFKLNVKKDDDKKYLVGIRHPFDAIISWYYLEHRESASYETLKKIFINKIKFYTNFIDKWIVYQSKNIYIYDYNNFVEKPDEELTHMIQFLINKNSFKEYKMDTNRLNNIVKNISIRSSLTSNYDTFEIENDNEIIEKIRILENIILQSLNFNIKSSFLDK